MVILAGLGPIGVMALVVAGNRLMPKWLPIMIAVWVTIVWIATGLYFYHDITHGKWYMWLLLLVDLIAAGSAWDSIWWIREHQTIKRLRYYVWWAFFWLALIIIATAGNLVLAWLAIEFSTLASGALIVEMGHRRALEAAWKYIVVASVGMLMAIIGIVFLYASLQFEHMGWNTLDYSNLHAHYLAISPIVRKMATILIVCGIGTKAGLVPFHTWLPDAHSVAPSPVSGLLSGILLGVSLVTIQHFVAAVPLSSHVFLSGQHLLLLFGILSVVVGTLALLVQKDIKRMLAYSSIEQVGIMAIGFGIGTPFAQEAVIWQLVFHAIIKSGLFYISGHLSVRYHSIHLPQMSNMFQRHRGLAVTWATFIIALAGLPPLGLAYSEWMILYGLWSSHLWVILALLSLSLILGFAALMHHLLGGMWGRTNQPEDLVGIAVTGGVSHE